VKASSAYEFSIPKQSQYDVFVIVQGQKLRILKTRAHILPTLVDKM
jgi:hypothetical protein